MFEPSLIETAAAAAAGELPSLSRFPILELFGGIMSLMVVGLTAVLYAKSNSNAAAAKSEVQIPPGGAADGVHLYFSDESWKALFKELDALRADVADLALAIGPLRELVMSEARDTRHDVKHNIHAAGQAAEGDATEIRAAIARLQSLIDRMNIDVVRIEERTRGKAK